MVWALAKEGASILVHHHTSSKEAEELLRQLKGLGVDVALVCADLSTIAGVEEVKRAAQKELDKLDVLINNASTFPQSEVLRASESLESESPESFKKTLAINLEAPFFLIQKLKPLLAQSDRALVINILDAHALDGFYSRPAYAASKAGLAAITQSMAAILAPTIRVCGLELGKILPGEGMSEEEAAKVEWIGVRPVAEAILKLVKEPQEPGYIEQIK
jgi:NAD(P)-dependent dehydrogenase (short-subunit alcohol dehydrogenase family)